MSQIHHLKIWNDGGILIAVLHRPNKFIYVKHRELLLAHGKHLIKGIIMFTVLSPAVVPRLWF